MFQLYANKNQLSVLQQEPVTSGSVSVYPVRFEFSEDWKGLTRTAVFRSGAESCAVVLDEDGETVIPWEVLKRADVKLLCGVYGIQDGYTILPTVWADLGWVLPGVAFDKEVQLPAPGLWEQQLDGKGDSLQYDGLNLSLMSGNQPLSTVQIASGEGGVVPVPGPAGGANLIAGDGITIEEDIISVAVPVKSMTQAEYDALPDKETQKGLYVVTDTTISLKDRGEVYSTEETLIGTWIDGKPLYRKTFLISNTQISHGNWCIVADVSNLHLENVLDLSGGAWLYGLGYRSFDSSYFTLGIIDDKTTIVIGYIIQNTVEVSSGNVTIEYTKTTDQEVSE